MRRRLTVLVTLVMGMVIAGSVAMWRASAAGRFGDDFTVTESGTGVYLDEATQAPPDFSKPIPAGDTVVFTADLLQDSRKIGQARGSCTSAFDPQFICTVVFSITRHGTLTLQVLFDLADPQGDYVVSGGTGDFAGRHGWAHFTTQGNGDEVHTFHLSD
jgi:Dirigent-like protein